MTTETQTQKSTLAALRPAQPASVDSLPAVNVGMTSLQGFELAQRAGKLLSASSLVPKEYQGNLSNCVIALNMAERVGADPLMVMQNLVIVHGKPTWSSQFLIATVNTCGRFTALRYEFFGKPGTDEWGCRAWAIEKATGEKLVGTDVTIKIAKDEGWYGKNGSKWKTIPQQMLMYRAGSWWTRAYAPELSMGLHTADEMRDVWDAERGEDGSFSVSMDEMRQAHEDIESGKAADFDPETGEVTEVEAEEATDGDEKEEAAPHFFNIEEHNITTQTGLKKASKALVEYLRQLPEEERQDMFADVDGISVVEALGKQGLGMEKKHYEALGITI